MTIAKMPLKFQTPKAVEKNEPSAKTVSVESRSSQVDLNSKAYRDFVKKAPTGMEASSSSRWKLRGRKVMITVQIDPEMLEQFDELCESLGQSRPALIRTFISEALAKAEGRR